MIPCLLVSSFIKIITEVSSIILCEIIKIPFLDKMLLNNIYLTLQMYTAEGTPVIKKNSKTDPKIPKTNLVVAAQWQCILQDKWIIGVELLNKSCW